MSENPLLVKCKSCGSKTEYDIIEQSYCCTSCARKISVVDAITNLDSWRKSQQNDIKEKLHELPHTFTHCPNCGAEFFFKENEATGICPYCDTPMIRKDYDESDSFPESIIPFKITLEEAKEKLLDLVDKPASSYSEEAEIAKKNINKMQGFYLPYCLIMGPINYNINREGTKRQFHCEIEVEKNFINSSKELDNLVLDAMEPYDWKEIVPFSFGYISGQLVKVKNIDENELTKRAVEEVASQSKKQITEELDSEVIEIKSDSVNLLTAPVLLPVYYFKVGDFTVAVNGQTGRVSMTNNHETKKIVNYSGWIVLPILIALEFLFFDSIDFSEKLEINIVYKILLSLYFFFVSPLGLIFILLPKKIKTIIEKLPIASDKCLAIRQEDQRLKYKFGEDVIQEKPNKLNFWELVDSKKEKILIEVFKSSTLIKLALFAMFYPICVGFVVFALVSLYHKSLPIFSNELIDILKVYGGWLIGVGSCYFFGGAIYNRIKYDFKLENYGSREFKLDKMIYSLGFIFGVVFSLIFSLIQFVGISLDDMYVTKQTKNEAIKAELVDKDKIKPVQINNQESPINKDTDIKNEQNIIKKPKTESVKLPELKQKDCFINNALTNNYLLLSSKSNIYIISYYDNNDDLIYYIYALPTSSQNERVYCYQKYPKTDSEKAQIIYRVNLGDNTFDITDEKTHEKWSVEYNKNGTLIKKVSDSEEKTIYKIKYIKLESSKEFYNIVDINDKLLGLSQYYNEKKALIVIKNLINHPPPKFTYWSNSNKPRQDGSMVLASPLMLLVDEFPENLRYIMMLELSQLE